VALWVAGGDDRPNFFAGGSDATVWVGSLPGVLAGCVAAAEVFDDDGQYISYQLALARADMPPISEPISSRHDSPSGTGTSNWPPARALSHRKSSSSAKPSYPDGSTAQNGLLLLLKDYLSPVVETSPLVSTLSFP